MKKLLLLIAITFNMINTYAWTIYNTTNSGIPSNNMRGIDFDQQGNTWIATDSGLAKFNGTTWQVFNTANSGIVSNNLLCIKIDNNNIKWIGTSDGLSKFDDTSWVNFTINNSVLSNNNVYSIGVDKRNKKYFLSGVNSLPNPNSQLITYDDSLWTQYNSENSLLFNDYITHLFIDSKNSIWLSYPGRTINGGHQIIIDSANNWSNYNLSSRPLCAAEVNDTIWIGTLAGIFYSTSTGWELIPNSENIRAWDIKKVGSKVLIRTNNSLEIYDLSNRTYKSFNSQNSPIYYPEFSRSEIWIDNNYFIWIPTIKGLLKTKCIVGQYSQLGLIQSCVKDSLKLSHNGTRAPGIWVSENDNACQNGSNNFTVSNKSIYRLFFTNEDGCSSTDHIKYMVNDSFSTFITVNQQTACLNQNTFVLNSINSEDTSAATIFKWNLIKSNSTLPNPIIKYDTTGIYKVSLISKSGGGCIDTAYKTLTVLPNPTAGPMLGETNALSTTTPYVYTVAQQPNHTYNWVVTNGIIAAGQGTNAATVQWLSNGKGYVKVEVANTFGCADTTSNAVNIGNVGLGEMSSLNQLVVYPNPSKGNFNVSINALKPMHTKISLINLLGQEIWSEQQMIQAGQQTLPINSNLAPGVYTLRITNAEEQVQQKIIIK